MFKSCFCCCLSLVLFAALGAPAAAGLVITEVMSASGSQGTPDWFELTNTGGAAEVVTGFRMDDNAADPNDFTRSVALLGITSIAPGESVLFIETSSPVADINTFRTFWGGSNSGLPGVQIGSYSGSGVGLSSNGDGVSVFNATGTIVAPLVTFGSATNGSSFGYDPINQVFGALSVAGQFGAFTSFDTTPLNTGSPGTIGNVPEPSTLVLAGMGLLALGFSVRRRQGK